MSDSLGESIGGQWPSSMERSAAARFASHCAVGAVPESQPHLGPCVVWTAGKTSYGYGVFHPSKQKTVRAHRYALTQKLGRPLQPGMFACHRCDNPACVNPEHLFEGTHQDNVDDSVAKMRHKHGERGSAKLSEDDVIDIRERRSRGIRISDLAAEYHVTEALICSIARGTRWPHAGGPRTFSYKTKRKAS